MEGGEFTSGGEFAFSVKTLPKFYLGEVNNYILLVVMCLTMIIINNIYEVGLSPAADLSSDFPV